MRVVQYLDASACRCVILCGCYLKLRIVRKLTAHLYQTLAERFLSNNHPAVIVLNSTRHNLRCGSTASVNENRQRQFSVNGRVQGFIAKIVFRNLSLGADNLLAFRNENVSHVDSLHQQASGIPAKVEDYGFCTLSFQLNQSGLDFLAGIGCEIGKLYVPYIRCHHIVVGDVAYFDLLTLKREFYKVLFSESFYRKV